MAYEEGLWRNSARNLLKLLKYDDLMAVATTMSAGRLKFATEEDAVTYVLGTCANPEELLSKKKLKHEYLLRYLWEEGKNSSSVDSKMTKIELVNKVLYLWNNASSISPQVRSTPYLVEEADNDDDDDSSKSNPSSSLDHRTNVDDAVDVLFATSFLQWFYDLLTRIDDSSVGHFYANCSMVIRCGVTPNIVVQEFSTNTEIVLCFAQLINIERLKFNPNLNQNEGGFATIREPHGALLIKNCGVVHRDSTCLGPYDVLIMLIQDPTSNNWKMQRVSLTINAPIVKALQ